MLRHIISISLAMAACATLIPTKVNAATFTVTPVDEVQASRDDSITFTFVFTPSATVRLFATAFGFNSNELLFVGQTPSLPPIFSIINEPITVSQIYKVLTPLKDGRSDVYGTIYYNEIDQFGNFIGLYSNTALGADIVPVPQQPVPEPLTMFGAAAALGYGAILKRKFSENTES